MQKSFNYFLCFLIIITIFLISNSNFIKEKRVYEYIYGYIPYIIIYTFINAYIYSFTFLFKKFFIEIYYKDYKNIQVTCFTFQTIPSRLKYV